MPYSLMNTAVAPEPVMKSTPWGSSFGIGVSKQTMSKMLSGNRMINIGELQKIASYFDVKMEDLMNVPVNVNEGNVVRVFMGKVSTEAAKEALRTVDELADMIIFHANVRDNAVAMTETWEI